MALKRVSGDRRFYLGLLDEFRRTYAGFDAELAALSRAGDREGRYRLVHTLTGVAGNLGMSELQSRARALEDELKAGQPGHPEPLLAALSKMLVILTALPPLPGGRDESAPDTRSEAGADAPDPELLAGLEACLEAFDPKAQDWLDRLSGLSASERAALQAALDSFDFEHALGLVRALRKDSSPKLPDSIPTGGQA
jgi:HPt (histidine-containing phosphotransfer) domain-containing protein